MGGSEAIAIIRRLGIKQVEAAKLLGVHKNTINRWAKGEPPSRPARLLLRILDDRGAEAIKMFERYGDE